MINIAIHIKNKARKIINLSFPEDWSAVSKKRFINSAELLFSKKMETYWVKAFLFCRLAGLKYKKFTSIFKVAYSDQDSAWEEGVELIQLIEMVDPFLEVIELRESKLQRFWLWEGPAKRLENISMNQWKYIDPFFTAAMDGKLKLDLLDEFLSVLYKPIFLPWSEKRTEKYKKRIVKWPMKIKLAMLLNYIGIRNSLAKEFDLVFAKPPKNSNSNFDPLWIQKVIYELPSEKFGDLGRIGKLKVPDALEFLQFLQEKENKK